MFASEGQFQVAAAFGGCHLEPLVAGPRTTQKSIRKINV
jgi:hypothetical protein